MDYVPFGERKGKWSLACLKINVQVTVLHNLYAWGGI